MATRRRLKLSHFFALSMNISLIACSNNLELEFFYDDPLVEAPTRSINLHLIAKADCRDVLSRRHHKGTQDTAFLKEYSFEYPARNAYIPLEGLPLDEEITVDVEAYDQGLTSISRSCTSFHADESEQLRIQLFALPKCKDLPQALDLTIAIDTSSTSLSIDPNLLQLKAIKDALLVPEIFSSWTVVSFGGAPKVRLNQSRDVETVNKTLDELALNYADEVRLYDGIALAAKNIRANALCKRQAALMVLTHGPDQGSYLQWQNAQLGLGGSTIDIDDNIYSIGVALNQQGFAALLNIIPKNTGSYLLITHPNLLEAQFYEVREELQALIP